MFNCIPSLRYRDARAAIEFLERAFGFERHAVYEDESGGIAHAELTYRGGMIMVGEQRVHPGERPCLDGRRGRLIALGASQRRKLPRRPPRLRASPLGDGDQPLLLGLCAVEEVELHGPSIRRIAGPVKTRSGSRRSRTRANASHCG